MTVSQRAFETVWCPALAGLALCAAAGCGPHDAAPMHGTQNGVAGAMPVAAAMGLAGNGGGMAIAGSSAASAGSIMPPVAAGRTGGASGVGAASGSAGRTAGGAGAAGRDAGAGAPTSAGADAGANAAGRGGGAPAAAGSGTALPSAPGYVHTQGAKLLDSQGREVRLTGVSWFGMETPNYAPYGLANRSLGSLLDQIKTLGFNTIRLPFSNQLFDAASKPTIGGNQNSDLTGLSGLQLMDKIVQAAGQRGLRIILDRHRPDSNAQSELWYTSPYGEQRWIDDWKMLATHYKSDATVIGADLHNEPRGMATWGDGNAATDWQLAAQRAGNAILQINSNWLIIVEGIEKYADDYYWWGGNLIAAGSHPVQLAVANRVVYSTHDYPPSLYAQTWFSATDYPNNLPSVWSRYWGYLAEQDIAPVFVGEFGTKLQSDPDKKWLHALAGYIAQHNLSWAFWCFNPNSGDTGGILQDDWTTVNQDKMNELKPILAPLIQ